MGARESAQMIEAKRMVLVDKVTPYTAAARVGLTRSAIYMAPWYKALRQVKSGCVTKGVTSGHIYINGLRGECKGVLELEKLGVIGWLNDPTLVGVLKGRVR